MNTERIFKIIIMEYTNDALKLEAELERVINSDLEIVTKTDNIKNILSKMVTIEASINKFTSMFSDNNNNNKKEE